MRERKKTSKSGENLGRVPFGKDWAGRKERGEEKNLTLKELRQKRDQTLSRDVRFRRGGARSKGTISLT